MEQVHQYYTDAIAMPALFHCLAYYDSVLKLLLVPTDPKR
jgi:hypothetical protein